MRLENLSWQQAKACFEQTGTVILPVGSTENHGPHMGLGTDTIIPQKILELVEPKTDVVIAPALPYGMADHHFGFPGTVSLGLGLLTQVLCKITSDLMGYGVKRFIFLNGHGGNIPAMETASVEINKKGGIAAMFSWYSVVGDMNPAWKGGHAAGQELSALMYARPEAAYPDQVRPSPLQDVSPELPTSGLSTVRFQGIDIPVKRLFINTTPYGWGGDDDPASATYEWGKEMIEAVSQYLADFANAFKVAPLPEARV